MENFTPIAIIEDDTDLREALVDLINQSDDFRCKGAFPNAEEAIAQIPSLNVRVVLSDIGLPDGTGIEVIKALNATCEAVPLFVMFTIFEDNDTLFKALHAGAIGYLIKKDFPDSILPALREVLQGGSPMSSTIARKVLQHFHQIQSKIDKKSDCAILSAREIEILEALSKGYLYKEIATQCALTEGTIKQHLHRIYKKLHVNNKMEAVNKWKGYCD